MAKKLSQYRVHWHLAHDGRDYTTGGKVALDEDAAAPLLAAGVITRWVGVEKPELETPAAPASAEQGEPPAETPAAD